MSLSTVLKSKRAELNLTLKEVGDRVGVSEGTVQRWESGNIKTLRHERITKLAEVLGVSPAELMGLDPVPVPVRIKRIPVLGTIPAGVPMEAIQDIIDWEEIPEAMCTGGKEYFGLRVKGDSMNPDYLDGDIVIVQKSPCCESGDICVVYVNGYDATLKKVKLGDDGSITLQPRNPEYAPRTYSPDEVASLPVAIAGVVVELRRKVK